MVLAAIFKTLPHNEVTRVVVTLWAIWYERRKAIHEESFQSPLSTNNFIKKIIFNLDVGILAPKEEEALK
jgi:hypothetical protein